MKNNKGITLIALVITIIVLLILAGVSIAMLTGENGILTKATTARDDTSKSQIADLINIELNDIAADMLAKSLDDSDTSRTVTYNGETVATITITKNTNSATVALESGVTLSNNGGITNGVVTAAKK